MIELLFVVAVAVFSLKTKRNNIILLLVFLLPFNDFIKNCCVVFGSGGTVFAFWKEVAILILFLRSYRLIENKIINKILLVYLCLCAIICVYFIIGLQNYDASICFRTMRNVLILPLLFISLAALAINDFFVKKLVLLLTLSTFLISLIGIWEIHMGGRLLLRTFMGDVTDGGGYNAPNFVMMGIDRMCSIMTVPNAFGYLMAFHASFLLYVFLYKKELFGRKWKCMLQIISIVTVFCLLESFCRTGWFLLVFSYFLALYYNNRRKFSTRILAFIITGLGLLLIAYILSPNIQTIVESTFTGEETSASDRKNNLSGGISFIVENPFGHGLGSSENSTDNCVYFTESTLVNLSTEIGIMGAFMYVFFLFLLSTIIRRTKSDFTPFSLAIIGVNMICIIPTNVYVAPYSYFVFIFSGLALMRKELPRDKNPQYDKLSIQPHDRYSRISNN